VKASRLENLAESFLFWSRWLMLPFYLGLVAALATLLVVFVKDVFIEAPALLMSNGETGVVVWVLTLIDLSLAGNLLLMVIFSGYENFVSRMDVANHPDRPGWMGKIDFSGMKLKLIASIVAISAIQLLKAFMAVRDYTPDELRWLVIIHLTFVVSGVLLALMDFISERGAAHHTRHE
jgi:uncharacterized protein (TIGR00645 family)